MTAAWVLYVLGVGALLALGAELSASALRHVGRASRFVYAGALAGVLALAVVAPKPAAVRVPVVSVTSVLTAPATKVIRELTLIDRVRAACAVVSDGAIALSGTIQRRVSPTTARLALAGWIGASIVLLALFALVNRRLAVARRAWPSRSLHGTTVRVSTGLGPAVLGFLRPEIVVPRSLLHRPDEEQRLILAHEREHLRTRDHLLLGGAWLCAIAFPWHPAVWLLVSRIRLAIELDCDARVLCSGASPRSYGGLLIDMAAQQRALQIGALALADGPSHLEQRILAMRSMKGRHALMRGLLVGGVGCMLLLAACEMKVPTAAEVASMDVGALEKKSAELDRLEGKIAKADYFVNGVHVSGDSARSIAAAKIGSVEVVKSQFAGGRDTIFVTTGDAMPRRVDDPAGYPGGRIDLELGSGAALMIDGVVQPFGIKAALDPTNVSSIEIVKPGKLPGYPNGLIVIETKRAKQGAARRPAESATFTERPVMTPATGQRTQFANSRDSAGNRVLVTTFDATKPFAITIDGARATMSELEALDRRQIRSETMNPSDMSSVSSDPAAKNGLLEVVTRKIRTQ